MKIHLAYGKKGLEIEVPERNLVKVMSMEGAPPIPDPETAVRASLEHPIDCSPLREFARKATTACIVICDITRPVPNKRLLPPILEILEQEGLQRSDITILIATGLHRPSTEEERLHMVGEAILSKYRVVDHRARVPDEHTVLGSTANRTPVSIDTRYCEADLKITVGFIEPHLMAGFSGGRKMVAPGCAGEETIKALHSPLFLEDPHCREGSIDKNPLHHELLQIARMAGHDFIVNVSLNAKGAITGVFSGNPDKAHARGVEFVRAAVRATVPTPVDVVVTTSAGFPLDLTYYQAVKGMTAVLPILKKGGMLILAAECAEGLGGAEFSTMAKRFPSAEHFRDWILSNPVVVDQWQLEECAKAARHADVVLVSSGVSDEERQGLFIQSADSVEEALQRAFDRYGSSASIAVVPKGPYTLVEIDTPV
ncbi:MAG: nickel-dependent lactate racemase [Ignavibacteriales bacterium]|nr:nickel-dependent lactate racemase [Ignavibacteriales bacterium]